MSDNHIESRLAAFVSGDLSDAEAAEVRAHVGECADCRESLAGYEVLEDALIMRRVDVPPVEHFLSVAPEPVVRPWIRTVVDAAFSAPGIISLILIWFGGLIFAYGDTITAFFTRNLGFSVSFQGVSTQFTQALSQVETVNIWVMTAAYGVVMILILASAGAMTFRFLRSE